MVAVSNPAAAAGKHKYPGEYIKRNGKTQPFSAFGIVIEIREGVSKWLTNLKGGQMQVARIVAPFGLSAVLFILSYVFLKDIEKGQEGSLRIE